MQTYIVDLIQTLGFPIAVSLYLLWRNYRQEERIYVKIEKSLDRIDKNLLILNISIGKLLNGRESEFKKILDELTEIESLKLTKGD